MKAAAPSSGITAAKKKGSPLWWMLSLGLHAVILCVLLVLFPYKEFIKPAARAKSQQPLVNQKTLEATARRIEEKQSAELARKLREIEALTAEIQSVEVTKRAAHAAFDRTFTELSPELARKLVATAREQLAGFLEKKQADEQAWSAFEKSDAEASAILAKPEDPAFKATLDSQTALLKAAAAAHEALNFSQAALLETQHQLAGRLGFLKARQPAIVQKQADLVAAWEKSMDSGGAYLAGFTPLLELASATARAIDSVNQTSTTLTTRQAELAKIGEAIATRSAGVTATEASLNQLLEERKNLDPADKKRPKELANRIKSVTAELDRTKAQLTKDQATKSTRETARQTTETQLRERSLTRNNSLNSLLALRKTQIESRSGYISAMARAIELQQSLDAAMTAALAPAVSTPSEPAKH